MVEKVIEAYEIFIFLYLILINFFTTLLLQEKLENKQLTSLIACFSCNIISGFLVYFLSLYFISTPEYLRLSAFVFVVILQALFWTFWFKQKIKDYILSFLLIWYVAWIVAFLGIYSLG